MPYTTHYGFRIISGKEFIVHFGSCSVMLCTRAIKASVRGSKNFQQSLRLAEGTYGLLFWCLPMAAFLQQEAGSR